MKALFKMDFDCGRQGSLEGLFIAEIDHVKKLIDDQIDVYFGEVLGKHSEVWGPIEDHDIKMVSSHPDVVKIFEDYKISSGHNPFHYTTINQEDSEDDMTVMQLIEKRLKP